MTKLTAIIIMLALPCLAQNQIGVEKTTRRIDAPVAGGRISTLPRALADSCVLGVTFQRDNGTNYYDVFGVNNIFADNAATQPLWATNRIYFDGINDYIQSSTALLPLTNDFTITAWLNRSSTNGIDTIFAQYVGGANNGRMFVQYEGAPGTCRFFLGNDAVLDSVSIFSLSDPGINEWHHIILMRSNKTFSLYFDGVIETNATEASVRTFLNVPNIIGSRTGTTTGYKNAPMTNYFHGAIDDTSIFRRSLTSNEIYNLYLSTKGQYGL